MHVDIKLSLNTRAVKQLRPSSMRHLLIEDRNDEHRYFHRHSSNPAARPQVLFECQHVSKRWCPLGSRVAPPGYLGTKYSVATVSSMDPSEQDYCRKHPKHCQFPITFGSLRVICCSPIPFRHHHLISNMSRTDPILKWSIGGARRRSVLPLIIMASPFPSRILSILLTALASYIVEGQPLNAYFYVR